jgi:hypothetical protein
VNDSDLNVAGASYWFYARYFIRGEAESLRDDNGGSRAFTPSWTGNSWDLSPSGGMKPGSILRRWTGADVQSNTNGGDDGRVYVGVTVTGPDANGLWHYEFAIHNRDNARGLDAFTLPTRPGAQILNAGFRDIDVDPANDWTLTVASTSVSWSTADAPLEYNTIYNFWFDSDAAPSSQSRALLDAFRGGPGLDFLDVATTAPLGAPVGQNLGFGRIGGNGIVPDFAMTGGLEVGEELDVMLRYAAPSSIALFFISDENTGFDYHGSTIVPFPPDLIVPLATDDLGEIMLRASGAGGSYDLFFQHVIIDPLAPEGVSMSNALEVVH